jgi:hypothetical protein
MCKNTLQYFDFAYTISTMPTALKPYTCALCGKAMATVAFTIGGMAVGPKCGIRAGFLQLSAKKSGQVRVVGRFRVGKADQGETLDLFEGIEE